MVSRTTETLEEARQAITDAGGAAEIRVCDVRDGEGLTALVEEVASTHGRLDILVNNAGMTNDQLIVRMTDEDFDSLIEVNLKSAFVTCRAAVRPMMRNRHGRMINIGSVTGIIGNPGQANYAAAKAGLIGMTKTLAKELGSKGITANVVAPGFVETDMIAHLPKDALDQVTKQLPIRRLGRPEEIAHAVSFLASDMAGYITGQVLLVDGGLA